jgi:hypothetical protein
MRIEKHVGIFERAIPDDLCDKFIEFYNNAEASGTTRTRQQLNDSGKQHKDDSATAIELAMVLHIDSYEFVRTFFDIFWTCYAEYSKEYWPLLEAPSHSVYTLKLQKTLPKQGYHVWHAENLDRDSSSRITAFMLYLNDVDEGGETEFLFESLRVKPTKGTLLIWPASYTHVHRGNPPLSGVKYVATAWTQF